MYKLKNQIHNMYKKLNSNIETGYSRYDIIYIIIGSIVVIALTTYMFLAFFFLLFFTDAPNPDHTIGKIIIFVILGIFLKFSYPICKSKEYDQRNIKIIFIFAIITAIFWTIRALMM